MKNKKVIFDTEAELHSFLKHKRKKEGLLIRKLIIDALIEKYGDEYELYKKEVAEQDNTQ